MENVFSPRELKFQFKLSIWIRMVGFFWNLSGELKYSKLSFVDMWWNGGRVRDLKKLVLKLCRKQIIWVNIQGSLRGDFL